MEEEKIIVQVNCELCDMHKTELGTWVNIKDSIETNFKELTEDNKVKLMICWFEQWKLDRRTEMIQGYKRTNIKDIRKER